ncbi:MAG: sugar transferase [Novosphingobium sp.]
MNTYSPNFHAFEAEAAAGTKLNKAALRLRLALYLGLGDTLAIAAAFGAVQTAAIGRVSPEDVRFLAGALLPIYLVSAFMVRTYAVGITLNYAASVARALVALGVTAAIQVLMVSLAGVGETIAQGPIVATVLIAAGLMAALRKGHGAYAERRLGGSLDAVLELYDGCRPRGPGQHPSCDTSTFFDPLRPNPFSLDHLARVIGRSDRVVLHCPGDRRTAWAHVLQSMNVHAEIVVVVWRALRPIAIGSNFGAATLVVASGPLDLHQRAIKRAFDIVFATGVLVGLAPLLVAVAIAIKLDSRGPVLFCQPRIGRQNKLFSVIKFRSMARERCDPLGCQSTRRDDPRTTRVGRFIRRTSIDELPQFINVLKGDMSVVGPRPHAISSTAEARLFWEVDDRYWRRHACRPGLTGKAQIEGLRGATASVSDLTDRVEADLAYLHSWSFWNDLAIILRTFQAVVHSDAY